MKRFLLILVVLLLTTVAATIPSTSRPTESTNPISAVSEMVAPTGECAAMTCIQCMETMLVVQRSLIDAGASDCVAQAVGLAYCQANCPTCNYCKIKAVNYAYYCE